MLINKTAPNRMPYKFCVARVFNSTARSRSRQLRPLNPLDHRLVFSALIDSLGCWVESLTALWLLGYRFVPCAAKIVVLTLYSSHQLSTFFLCFEPRLLQWQKDAPAYRLERVAQHFFKLKVTLPRKMLGEKRQWKYTNLPK